MEMAVKKERKKDKYSGKKNSGKQISSIFNDFYIIHKYQ
jgi:hypothetical protein